MFFWRHMVKPDRFQNFICFYFGRVLYLFDVVCVSCGGGGGLCMLVRARVCPCVCRSVVTGWWDRGDGAGGLGAVVITGLEVSFAVFP